MRAFTFNGARRWTSGAFATILGALLLLLASLGPVSLTNWLSLIQTVRVVEEGGVLVLVLCQVVSPISKFSDFRHQELPVLGFKAIANEMGLLLSLLAATTLFLGLYSALLSPFQLSLGTDLWDVIIVGPKDAVEQVQVLLTLCRAWSSLHLDSTCLDKVLGTLVLIIH